MSIGENIKKRREELDMTQTELAKRVGYADKSSISKIEKGKTDVFQSDVVKIAKILQTTPAYLMGWTKEDGSLDGYYFNEETAKLAQEMFDDPDMRALYHMKRNMNPESYRAHVDMMKRMYKLEHPEDDDDFTGC